MENAVATTYTEPVPQQVFVVEHVVMVESVVGNALMGDTIVTETIKTYLAPR